jgi:serine phosphatase RsbU (regulator of sigma subunit)
MSNYIDKNIKDSVEKYASLAIDIKLKIGDLVGYVGDLNNISQFYYNQGEYKKSEHYLRKAIDTPFDNLPLFADLKQQLAYSLIKLGRHEEANELFGEYILLLDSVHKIQTVEKLSEMEVKYETGKKEEELMRLSAQQEINTLKIRQSKILTLVSVFSVLVFLVIVVVLFQQNKKRKEANKLLQTQNNEILNQKKEITDSINYAKRIQLSILPPEKMVKRLLPDAFIYYKPKDVVSGDFYWVEEKNGLVMFAAVDCTGHGVPGAMMSVVGLNLLNRAVNEKELTKPSDILQYLDIGVTDTLRQNQIEGGVKDGMDLSLCTYNTSTKQLQYAGAFNNLWVVRKNFSSSHNLNSQTETLFEDGLLEIKADKFPIGSNTNGVADTYTNHTIQLQKGDCVYLYSDGYADQFGGPKGKKFKYNALKKTLISISHLSPAQQREELSKTYEQWRGNLEQVDDVLIIGVCV